MTEEVFIRTIRNRFFLRGVRRVVQLPSSQNWTLPSGYSFDLDTAANHSSEAWHATIEAVGFRVHMSPSVRTRRTSSVPTPISACLRIKLIRLRLS